MTWLSLPGLHFDFPDIANSVTTCNFQLHVQWLHVDSLKLAMGGVLTPQELANATNQGFGVSSQGELILKHLTAHHQWQS